MNQNGPVLLKYFEVYPIKDLGKVCVDDIHLTPFIQILRNIVGKLYWVNKGARPKFVFLQVDRFVLTLLIQKFREIR